MIGRRSLLLAGVALPVAARAQCVTSAPAVDACRGGVRIAGPVVPPGATLNLDFTTGTLDPSITFTRASTATYFDVTGTLQTAAINAPRFDYDPVTHAARGLLIEEARTNLLLNSATLGTQSVAVTAQSYALSFYGTGTVTLSGASTAGPLVGTGVFPQRVSLVFTPTAGTLTLTVTGSVLNAQTEAGSFPTSYIPTTAAAVTRAYDSCYIASANMSPWFVSPGGSWMAEFIQSVVRTVTNTSPRIVGIHSAAGTTPLWVTGATNVLGTYDGSQTQSVNSIVAGAISKGASNWAPSNGRLCLNGGAVAATATMATGFGALATAGIGILGGNPGTLNESMTGYVRAVRYWPRVLSDAELQQVTT